MEDRKQNTDICPKIFNEIIKVLLEDKPQSKIIRYYCSSNCYRNVQTFVNCYDIIWKNTDGKYLFYSLCLLYIIAAIISFFYLIYFFTRNNLEMERFLFINDLLLFYLSLIICCTLRILYFVLSLVCFYSYSLVAFFSSLPALLFVVSFMVIPKIFCTQIAFIYEIKMRFKISTFNKNLVNISIIIFTFFFLILEFSKLYLDKIDELFNIPVQVFVYLEGTFILICFVIFVANLINYCQTLSKFYNNYSEIRYIKILGILISTSLLFKTIFSLTFGKFIYKVRLNETCRLNPTSSYEIVESIYFFIGEILPIILSILILKVGTMNTDATLNMWLDSEFSVRQTLIETKAPSFIINSSFQMSSQF